MRYTFAVIAAFIYSSTALAGEPVTNVQMPAVAVPAATVPAGVAAPKALVLPANTEVVVTPDDTLTTKNKKLKVGNKFKVSTVLDVVLDGQVVIPKGTTGEGTITFLKGAGSFGKAGKLEVAFNTLDLNGRQIGLTGRYREEGQSNGGAAVGAVVAAGLIGGAFVQGHSAEIAKGQQLRAHTSEALTF